MEGIRREFNGFGLLRNDKVKVSDFSSFLFFEQLEEFVKMLDHEFFVIGLVF